LSFFLMPASAVQTKTWFRPNGWFTDREVAIVVNRVLRDDPSKGDMHNRSVWRLEHIDDRDLCPNTRKTTDHAEATVANAQGL